MNQALAKFLFKLLGWKTLFNVPSHIKKYVIVGAPHTSNWDGLYAPLGVWAMGINFRFLAKKDLFKPPFGWILKTFGAMPVERSKKTDLTTQVASFFKDHDDLVIGVTPEGTRSANPNWKKGFYYIAQKASVPIVFGYLDYEKKICGVGPVFESSGDIDKDMPQIKAFFKDIKAKHLSKFQV